MQSRVIPPTNYIMSKHNSTRRPLSIVPDVILSRNASTKSTRERRRSLATLSTHGLQKSRKCIGDYYVGKTLGKGASGRVKLGVHRYTGEQVAIKIISKAYLAENPTIEKAVRREIAIMKLIRHPNVMGLIDVIDDSSSSELHLILEYVKGGELFEYLVNKGKLTEAEARHHFQQIILGLDFCHHHLVCHRDLKPENLLLDDKNNIKIADFGMASLQPSGLMLETSCGSPHYASPEIVAGIPYNGAASDIWSCGVILYALLTGHLPFDDENIRHLLKKVKLGKYSMPQDISRQAQDLVRRILVVDPAKRINMEQILKHPWFCEAKPVNIENLPMPPTAAEIGRPVENSSEIDDRILQTIKFLWGESHDDDVIRSLLCKEHNMQKVVYVLLQQHAERYWKIDHDDEADVDDDENTFQKYHTIISRRVDRNRRCMSVADHVRKPRPSTPWSAAPKEETSASSRRFSEAITSRSGLLSPNAQSIPLPPTPVSPDGEKSEKIKKSETFYSRIFKSMIPSRRQTKEILPPTPSDQSTQFTLPAFTGTLRRKSMFNRRSPPSPTESSTDEEKSDAPGLPRKSSLRQQTGLLLQRNRIDPVSPTGDATPSPKINNIKRLSIRVPSAFKTGTDSLRFGFRTAAAGRSRLQHERKQLDISTFQRPDGDSRMSAVSSGTQSAVLPPLSDGSTLSSSSSSNSSITHHPLDKIGKIQMSREMLPSPPPLPLSASYRRGESQRSIHSKIELRRGSAPLLHNSENNALLRRPTTPTLSNESTISNSTLSSPSPTSPAKSSWLSNLFIFKQPKVCTINIPRNTSSETLRFLYHHMNKTVEARFYEKCDKFGASRYKTEIKSREGKPRQVKCRIDILKSPEGQCSNVVQFTQQQGDALLLASVVQQVQENIEMNISA